MARWGWRKEGEERGRKEERSEEASDGKLPLVS